MPRFAACFEAPASAVWMKHRWCISASISALCAPPPPPSQSHYLQHSEREISERNLPSEKSLFSSGATLLRQQSGDRHRAEAPDGASTGGKVGDAALAAKLVWHEDKSAAQRRQITFAGVSPTLLCAPTNTTLTPTWVGIHRTARAQLWLAVTRPRAPGSQVSIWRREAAPSSITGFIDRREENKLDVRLIPKRRNHSPDFTVSSPEKRLRLSFLTLRRMGNPRRVTTWDTFHKKKRWVVKIRSRIRNTMIRKLGAKVVLG